MMDMNWVTVTPPTYVPVPDGVDLAALKAGIDDDGTIWAWCGLVQPRMVAIMLASADGEPVLIDNGAEYMRLDWMRSALVTNETESELVNLVERQVRRMTYQ